MEDCQPYYYLALGSYRGCDLYAYPHHLPDCSLAGRNSMRLVAQIRIKQSALPSRALRDCGSHQQPIIVENFVRENEDEDQEDRENEEGEEDQEDEGGEGDEENEEGEEGDRDKGNNDRGNVVGESSENGDNAEDP